jgi:hypothetical protein
MLKAKESLECIPLLESTLVGMSDDARKVDNNNEKTYS